MGAHSLTVITRPNLGRTSEKLTTLDGNGVEQVREIILDEAFVERVRAAYAVLDLTQVARNEIITTVVARLADSEENSELVPVLDVEQALNLLLDKGAIDEPTLV